MFPNYANSFNNDELYNDVNQNDAHSVAIPFTTFGNNTATASFALTASVPVPYAITTSSETENPGIQGSEPTLTDINTMGISRVAQNLASTLNGSPAPLASTGNTEATGQPQAPVKHAKGLAVMGTGVTDKYIYYCIS
jgi:hypothetical protein